MLAADAEVDVGSGLSALLHGDLDQLADAVLVKVCKRILLVDLGLVVVRKELAGIISGEAEGHLGQVVGAEAEELRLLCDLICKQSRSGDLDHRADVVLNVGILLLLHLLCSLADRVLDEAQLLDIADKGNHDLGLDVVALLLVDLDGGLHDGTGLHSCDLREGDGETASSVAHHRVELLEVVASLLDFCDGQAHLLCHALDLGLGVGNELMQRRIQEADRDRSTLHGLVQALEVALLERDQLVQGSFSLLSGIGEDHLADLRDTVRVEEHVLGSGQTDALCAEADRIGGVCRGICIRADVKSSVLVGPVHDALEVSGDGSLDCRDIAEVDLAGGAIQGDVVALVDCVAAECEVLLILVHIHVTAAGDAAGAHASCDNGCMGGHAASHGQDALCGVHAVDVLRRGLLTDHDDSCAGCMSGNRILRVEVNASCSSSRRCGKGLADLGGEL